MTSELGVYALGDYNIASLYHIKENLPQLSDFPVATISKNFWSPLLQPNVTAFSGENGAPNPHYPPDTAPL